MQARQRGSLCFVLPVVELRGNFLTGPGRRIIASPLSVEKSREGNFRIKLSNKGGTGEKLLGKFNIKDGNDGR